MIRRSLASYTMIEAHALTFLGPSWAMAPAQGAIPSVANMAGVNYFSFLPNTKPVGASFDSGLIVAPYFSSSSAALSTFTAPGGSRYFEIQVLKGCSAKSQRRILLLESIIQLSPCSAVCEWRHCQFGAILSMKLFHFHVYCVSYITTD